MQYPSSVTINPPSNHLFKCEASTEPQPKFVALFLHFMKEKVYNAFSKNQLHYHVLVEIGGINLFLHH